MAVEQRIYDISLEAAEDLSDYQYHVVEGHAAFSCVASCAASDESLGILQNKPEENQTAEVRRVGISKGVCGGTIPVWSYVTPDANSHLVVAAEGERYVGLAMQAGVEGRVISILVEFGTTPAAT